MDTFDTLLSGRERCFMSTMSKRQFTDEFKREAVALWETSGRMQTEVARELGI